MRSLHFGVTPTVRAGRHTLLLAGELDLASSSALEHAVAHACEQAASEVVLDLSGLRFIDVHGTRALLAARAKCDEYKCDFAVTHESRQVRRVRELFPALFPQRSGPDELAARVRQQRMRAANGSRRSRPNMLGAERLLPAVSKTQGAGEKALALGENGQ